MKSTLPSGRQSQRSFPWARALFAFLLVGSLALSLLGRGRWQSPTALAYGIARPVTHHSQKESPRALRTVPIRDLRPGMRVLAENPELAGYDLGESTIEPADWRIVSLTMGKPNGGTLQIQLLRPSVWLYERAWNMGLLVGNFDLDLIARQMVGRTIFLDMAEMGAEGEATIVAIGPCPAIEPPGAPGRYVVTGTFCHSAANLVDLDIEGEVESLGVTDNHLFWSADRASFVPSGKLEIGERLRRADGTTARLVRSTPRRGPPISVYNLEVDAQHVYHVGASGILVHNKYLSDKKVYVLIKKGINGEEQVVYYGVSDDPARRVGQHFRQFGNDAFDYMRELTDPLKHHTATSIEGGFIRKQLKQLFGDENLEGRVKESLAKADLLNKNRSSRNWIDPATVSDLIKENGTIHTP